jgi:hypothetical protein
MATVTPNYSWPVPTSTDLVKDGATSIEALGDAIDATVFGLPASSLVLIKTQTIGTAVASVNVTSAFSATYVNYKILVTDGGVGSSTQELNLKLGATTTGYYYGRTGTTFAGAGATGAGANVSSFANITQSSAVGISCNIELQNPFLAKETIVSAQHINLNTNGSAAWNGGYLANTTSYTDFTLTPASGTLTGGVIYVYGYKK